VTEQTEGEREREREREREETSMLIFCHCKIFGFIEPSSSVESFNFHSSGQLKICLCGYCFSPARKLRKTARKFIDANVS
jgi:hypothetical protein